MIKYLLTCRSLTYAQKIAHILASSGLNAVVMRAPYEIGSEGCGYCVKIPEKNLNASLRELNRHDMGPVKIFAQYENGRTSEVRL